MPSQLSGEQTLLAYARVYLKYYPDSADLDMRRLDLDAYALERDITKFLDDNDWYCDKWPGKQIVTFFSYCPRRGTTSTWGVSFEEGAEKVYRL